MRKIRKLFAAVLTAALTAALAVTAFAASASASVSITAGSAKTLSLSYEGYGLEGSFEMSGDTDSFDLEASYVFLYSTSSEGSEYLAEDLVASAGITASENAEAGDSVTVTLTYYTFDINGVETGPLTYTWTVTVVDEASQQAATQETTQSSDTTTQAEDTTTAAAEETTQSLTSPQTGSDYDTVEIEPTYNFCNITAHTVIIVLFCISLAANIVFVILAVLYSGRKKKDRTPLVNYDISDDD